MRVWDLPTRLFHWLLALTVVASVVSAKIGGNAMAWHFRFGYLILTLLAFRLLWGLVGGHWSRFHALRLRADDGAALPARAAARRRTPRRRPQPAGSVVGVRAARLAAAAGRAPGCVADDEIATVGPLNRFVSSATALDGDHWHKDCGQWILITLVLLHVAAIVFYLVRRGNNLIVPMLVGDKQLPPARRPAVDGAGTRVLRAAAVRCCCAGAVYALVTWAG